MNELSRRIALPPSDMENEPAVRARPRPSGPVGVLDIGTTKIACVIGRIESDGTPRVLGFAWQRARGVRGGGIVDIHEAERAIRACVGQAETEADVRLRSIVVNLSCGQPESRAMNLQWPISGRAVTDQDVRRVLLECRARAASEGRDIIHALPLAWAADDAQGVADPRGLYCDTLSVRMHVVDAMKTALLNVGACLQLCDLEVTEMVSAPFAAGLSSLVEDERLLGATVLDMGGGTTGMAVFGDGQLLHTSQMPLGGQHITNDIARVLSTPVAHAERLKTLYGSAQASPDDEREMLPVPMVGEEEHHIAKVPRSAVVNIICPRLEETFEMARERLDNSGLGRAAGTRVILVGGASQMSGITEMAAKILNRGVRLGRPAAPRGLPESASGPAFATVTGLLAWTAGAGRTLHDIDLDAAEPGGLLRRAVNFLRDRL